MMMATTSRIWIKPPIVVLVTRPSSHRTIRITQIVHNIVFSFQFGTHRRRLRFRPSQQRISSSIQLGHGLFDRDVILELSHALDFFGEVAGIVLLGFRVDEAA